MYVMSTCSNVSLQDTVSLWIFCLDDLSTDASGVLKSSAVIAFLSVLLFVNICFMFKGSCVLCVDIYNCYVLLLV